VEQRGGSGLLLAGDLAKAVEEMGIKLQCRAG
jgi:hypothetical protein